MNRRTFMASTVAAVAPLPLLGRQPISTKALAQFVTPINFGRGDALTQVFRFAGSITACDCRIAVRIPDDLRALPQSEGSDVCGLWRQLDNFPQWSHPPTGPQCRLAIPFNVPPLRVECDTCDESWREHCDECDGTGTVDNLAFGRAGALSIALRYVAKVLKTFRYVRWYLREPGRGERDPIRFLFDGGEGIVMPSIPGAESEFDYIVTQ